MNGLVRKARWLGAVVAAGALLVTGTEAVAAAPAGPAVTVRQGVASDTVASDTVALGAKGESFTVSPDASRAFVVASYDIDPGHGARVVRSLDLRTGVSTDLLTVSSFDMVGRPTVSPDGSRVYVTVNWDLLTFDAVTGGLLARVATPDQPRPGAMTKGGLNEVTVSPDGTRLWLSQYGPYGVRMGSRAGRVLAYDPATRTFPGSVTLTGFTVNQVVLGPDATDAWVGTADNLYHLDVEGAVPQVIDRVAGFGSAEAVVPAPDGRTVYASGYREWGTVSLDTLDPATNTFRSGFSLGPFDNGPQLLGASPDSRRLRVFTGAKTAQAALLSYDPATGAAVPGETVTGFGLDSVVQVQLGADGHTLYLAGLQGGGSVLRTVRF
ncbi:YncE family protein [Kitasatospora sp. NPDC048298]|uniref:YncE family protein n=1 Tax=Kitasatospora sp. NPDC048298 TaxID=3364049 RepID=UPI003723EE71